MKLINLKIKLSSQECERFLNTRVVSKSNIGINWGCSANNKLILLYEDGTRTIRGDFQLLKSYFFGKIKNKKGKSYLSGVIISGPVISILSILSMLVFFYFLIHSSAIEMLVPIVSLSVFTLWVFIDEKKNRDQIESYLRNIFT